MIERAIRPSTRIAALSHSLSLSSSLRADFRATRREIGIYFCSTRNLAFALARPPPLPLLHSARITHNVNGIVTSRVDFRECAFAAKNKARDERSSRQMNPSDFRCGYQFLYRALSRFIDHSLDNLPRQGDLCHLYVTPRARDLTLTLMFVLRGFNRRLVDCFGSRRNFLDNC
jgi:hypothetical protein